MISNIIYAPLIIWYFIRRPLIVGLLRWRIHRRMRTGDFGTFRHGRLLVQESMRLYGPRCRASLRHVATMRLRQGQGYDLHRGVLYELAKTRVRLEA